MPESRFVRSPSALLVRFLCLFLAVVSLPARAADKPVVAVLYFGYGGKTPELEVLRKGLAQMLITDLSGFGTAKLVERDRLQAVMDELDLGQTSRFDAAKVAKVGRLLGARYLVFGDYFDLLGSLRVDAKVIDVEKGVIVRSLGARGTPEEFFAFEQTLAQDLNKALGELIGEAPASSPGSPPPPSKMARRLTMKTALRYSKALDAKDRKDVETAKKELKAVLQEQPDFVLATADLASLMK